MLSRPYGPSASVPCGTPSPKRDSDEFATKNSGPKTAVSARRSVPWSLVRDVIGLVEHLRRQVPALREAGCSSRGKGTAQVAIGYAARRS